MTDNLSVRILTPEDAQDIAALHRQIFEKPWAETDFFHLLTGTGALGLGAHDLANIDFGAEKAPLLGFAIARTIAGEAEIITLGVSSQNRRCGIARALLAALLKHNRTRSCSKVFLEVAEDNKAALTLYLAAGFKPIGKRTGYYRKVGKPATNAVVLSYPVGIVLDGADLPA